MWSLSICVRRQAVVVAKVAAHVTHIMIEREMLCHW